MKKTEQVTPNQRLRETRKQHYWTQSQVAEKVGTTVVNVNRWERGTTVPSLYFQQKLCELFGKSLEELGLAPASKPLEQIASISTLPQIWNVPLRRNLYFTGRQNILNLLEKTLWQDNTATLTQTQAISGLGGIGKTQTAVEYAFRYQNNYNAVLWAKADSREILTSDFMALASLLNLPEKNEPDQSQAVEAVKHWLIKHTGWLLILDNIENIDLAHSFLPINSNGHILLTTRTQSIGSLAQCINLEKMEPEDGALLLLRRARLIEPTASLAQASATDRTQALLLAHLLDGLPLALDQAAAYIEETDCGLTGYVERYHTHQAKLLKLRGNTDLGHPETVATTWSLSFEQVQKANPAAADLLRLCAFLHSDAIAEEIVANGATALEPTLEPMAEDPIELDAAIRELRKYSLVRRDPEAHALYVHRLVQAVLKTSMDEQTQRKWAERTVLVVNHVLPADLKFEMWPRYQRYLPHAQVCATYIEQWQFKSSAASRLLAMTGSYLRERCFYSQAEPLLQQALAIRQQILGPEHPDTAQSLNSLALLYQEQGKYAEAEILHQQALTIWTQTLEPTDLTLVDGLENLATLYFLQGKYDQDIEILQRVLAIREQVLGPLHASVAFTLNSIASVFTDQDNYTLAEQYGKRSLAIIEQTIGLEHPETAPVFNNLAVLYTEMGKYEQAEQWHRKALAIREQALGPDHHLVSLSLSNLGYTCYMQGKYIQAEPLYLRALAIDERNFGSEHPDVAITLDNLGALYREQGKYEQSQTIHLRALAIREQVFGSDHKETAYSLKNLAKLYAAQSLYRKAEPYYQRALAIYERQWGMEHLDVADILENYSKLLRHTGRVENALRLEERASAIRQGHTQKNPL